MIVKILDYDSKKGIGVYQECTRKRSKHSFRYDRFYKLMMISPGGYAKLSKGKLKEIKIGFFRKLWFKVRGV